MDNNRSFMIKLYATDLMARAVELVCREIEHARNLSLLEIIDFLGKLLRNPQTPLKWIQVTTIENIIDAFRQFHRSLIQVATLGIHGQSFCTCAHLEHGNILPTRIVNLH